MYFVLTPAFKQSQIDMKVTVGETFISIVFQLQRLFEISVSQRYVTLLQTTQSPAA